MTDRMTRYKNIRFCFMIFALKPHAAWIEVFLKERFLQEQTCALKTNVFNCTLGGAHTAFSFSLSGPGA